MRLATTIIIWTIFYQFGKCHGSRVEINVVGKSGIKAKVICESPHSMPSGKDNGKILWEGSKFGPDERRKAELNAPNISVPDMTLKARRLKCLLSALKSINKREGTKMQDDGQLRQQREMAAAAVTANVRESDIRKSTTREKRESAGTIQTETGNCPPGQRIDKDRCFPCFPGSYTSGQETECFLCPKDFFMSKEGADACWPCPDGKKTLKEGADSESVCIDLVAGMRGFSYKWIILIIFLAIVIICTWILIIFLWIRLYYSKNSRVSTTKKDEETGLKNLIQTLPSQEQTHKSKQSEENYVCKRHEPHTQRKQLMFDVNIKGSAILADKNSSSIKSEGIYVTKNCDKEAFEGGGTIKEHATQEQVEISTNPNRNMPGTSKYTENVQFAMKPDAQKNIIENNSRDLYKKDERIGQTDVDTGKKIDQVERTRSDETETTVKELYFDQKDEGIGQTKVDTDKKIDHVERTSSDENKTTVKEPEIFRDKNRDEVPYDSVQHSESSGSTSENGKSSNDLSPTKDSSDEAEEKTSQITESTFYSLKPISITTRAYQNPPTDFEKHLGQTENFSLSYENMFSLMRDDSTNWTSSRDPSARKKGDIHPTMESAFRKLNKPHQYQTTSNNASRRSEGMHLKKVNQTKPSSCLKHQDFSNPCHVDVVVVPILSCS